MLSRLLANQAIRQGQAQRATQRTQRREFARTPMGKVLAARHADDSLKALLNVANGVKIAGMPERMFAARTATLVSVAGDKAIVRTAQGTLAVPRKFVKPAAEKEPEVSLSYPTRDWVEVAPGLSMRSFKEFYP